MKLEIADGDAYIEGRSPQKARELLAKAEAAGIDTALVRTTSGGYIVPKELGGEGGDDTLVEVGNNLPRYGYSTAIDDPQVAATVGAELLAAVQPVSDAGAVEGAILNQSEPTNAQTVGTAEGNGSSVVGDSAVLVQDFKPEDEGDTAGSEAHGENAGEDDLFDPTKHKVPEVQAYLATADDAEKTRVLEAEKASATPRKTLTGEGE